MELSIEVANDKTIDFFFDSAKRECWEPGLNDNRIFSLIDKNGFFIGKLDNEIVGCISAVKYDESFGFIGYYIVSPSYRGKGYGLRLFRHALSYLDGLNIGLDAVNKQIPNYIKSGFFISHYHIRFQGKGLRPLSLSSISIYLVPLRECNIELLKAFDRRYFPSSRDILLDTWRNDESFISIAYVDSNEIKGYGVIRKSVNGYRVAPLNAVNSLIASNIFQYLRFSIGNQSDFFIDIPEINVDGVNSLRNELQLQEVGKFARMYTKDKVSIDWNGVYALTSVEIG